MNHYMKCWQFLKPMNFTFAEANGYAIHARTPQANHTMIEGLALSRA